MLFFFVLFFAVYIEMVDLLRDFDDPAVMDIKMGSRYGNHFIHCTFYTKAAAGVMLCAAAKIFIITDNNVVTLIIPHRTYVESELAKARVKETLRPVSNYHQYLLYYILPI